MKERIHVSMVVKAGKAWLETELLPRLEEIRSVEDMGLEVDKKAKVEKVTVDGEPAIRFVSKGALARDATIADLLDHLEKEMDATSERRTASRFTGTSTTTPIASTDCRWRTRSRPPSSTVVPAS